MKHAISFLGIGLVCGVTLAQFLPLAKEPGQAANNRDKGWIQPEGTDPVGLPTASRAPTDTSAGFTRRARVYQLAGQADQQALEALLNQLLARPDSPGRRFSAQVLLSRYLDFDPTAALRWARKLSLPVSVFGQLYDQWAETDPEAALFALQFESNLAAVQAIGEVLIEALGADAEAIERVAAALPMEFDRNSFKAQAYAAMAVRDPQASWEIAATLEDPQLRLRTQRKLVETMVEQDPIAALLRAGEIDDRTVRQSASKSVLERWLNRDPAAVLAYLASIGDEPPMDWGFITGTVYSEIALADPLLLLQTVDQLPLADRARARAAALNRWAKLDPQAAVDFATTQPAGQQRRAAINDVGRAYARVDPAGAVAWAKSMQARSPRLLSTVLSSIAVKDPALALGLVDGLDSSRAQAEAMQGITMHLAANGKATLAGAHILTMEDKGAQTSALEFLGPIWASNDPEAALAWFLDNRSALPSMTLDNLAATFAQSNPQQAARFIDRVPADMRSNWMTRVAEGLAHEDPGAAQTWLEQFRGEPGYGDAAATVMLYRGRDDPDQLISALNDLEDPQLASQAAGLAADTLASREPAAAAAWAAQLDDESTRIEAVGQVARQWAESDAGAARSWILGLGGGLARDAAITHYLTAQASEAALLSAYSSDTARQIGIQEALYGISRRDPEAARQLIDDYITDPTLRARAEQVLNLSR